MSKSVISEISTNKLLNNIESMYNSDYFKQQTNPEHRSGKILQYILNDNVTELEKLLEIDSREAEFIIFTSNEKIFGNERIFIKKIDKEFIENLVLNIEESILLSFYVVKPIHLAILKGNIEIVELLLKYGQIIDEKILTLQEIYLYSLVNSENQISFKTAIFEPEKRTLFSELLSITEEQDYTMTVRLIEKGIEIDEDTEVFKNINARIKKLYKENKKDKKSIKKIFYNQLTDEQLEEIELEENSKQKIEKICKLLAIELTPGIDDQEALVEIYSSLGISLLGIQLGNDTDVIIEQVVEIITDINNFDRKYDINKVIIQRFNNDIKEEIAEILHEERLANTKISSNKVHDLLWEVKNNLLKQLPEDEVIRLYNSLSYELFMDNEDENSKVPSLTTMSSKVLINNILEEAKKVEPINNIVDSSSTSELLKQHSIFQHPSLECLSPYLGAVIANLAQAACQLEEKVTGEYEAAMDVT